ncbi:hydrolase 1, exosortase A system-associated [Janthinobacterium sp. BJB412]|nr:hydrolase 1, exosortase A system-associated [Janthinobacterium sp. BJB412]
MPFDEHALQFSCEDAALIGILSRPRQAATRGVLVVVGGPQYRAGSHRQFTLLARALAAQGIPVLRFDYRGMGDSEGAARDFEAVSADLRAAIDEFFRQVPTLRDVVVWGLCDGASAALFYAAGDPRVAGLALLNPWVRSQASYARTTLRHYYLARLRQGEFWRKLLGGRFDLRAAAASLRQLLQASRAGAPATAGGAGLAMPGNEALIGGARLRAGAAADSNVGVARGASSGAGTGANQRPAPAPYAPAPADISAPAGAAALPERMLAGLRYFPGKVMFIFSGNDLTAKEFLDMVDASKHWRRLLAAPRISRHLLADADHTFSRAAWRDEVARLTADWVRSW